MSSLSVRSSFVCPPSLPASSKLTLLFLPLVSAFLSGQSNVMTTSEGVKIGAIGGDWDEAVWDYSTKSSKPIVEGEEEEVSSLSHPSFRSPRHLC